MIDLALLDLSSLSEEDKLEILGLVSIREQVVKERLIDTFFTDDGTITDFRLYPKHLEFFAAGKTYRIRLFRAANRVGKTTGAGCEFVYHVTGEYPEFWEGHKFDGSQDWWVCGKSSETVNQILQQLLLGPVGHIGTGLIPKESLDMDSLKDAKKSGTPINSFRVKHKSGGLCTIEFKSYDQGRQAFEGTERNIWADEEMPLAVYVEMLLRTMTNNRLFMLTFTPLKGGTEVVNSFSIDGNFTEGEVGVSKWVTSCTWDDVPHLTQTDKDIMWASIPPFQRDARTRGIPVLGSGVIYPVQEEDYLIDRFPIPDHWPRLYGLDVGNKTAAIWIAKDPDTNVLYAYWEYYKEREEPAIHTAGIKVIGDWIPGAIDPAARGRSQKDGEQLMQLYTDLGLLVSPAINAVSAGLYQVWDMLSTGQLKIFPELKQLLKEMRTYSRDEKGNVIKENDHLCDALRYAVMTRDIAIIKKKPSSGPRGMQKGTWIG